MPREFRLFGFSHLVTLAVIIIGTVFAIHYLQRYDRERLQKRLHPWLALLMATQIFLYRGIFLIEGDFHLDNDLPLHLCGLSEILLTVYLLRANQKLFDVLYYFVLTGAALGPIIPDITQDFPATRFFALFVPHALMVFILLYLIVVQKKRPSPHSYMHAFKVLCLWALILAPINYYLPGNYLYLRQPPQVNFKPVEWLPPWPWYLLVLAVFFLGLYRLAYQPFATEAEISVAPETNK